VIVPLFPSHFSALGMLVADERHEAINGTVDHIHILFALSRTKTIAEMVEEAKKGLRRGESPDFQVQFDLRYVGQEFTLSVPVTMTQIDKGDRKAIRHAFDELHEQRYAHHATDEPVEIINVRLVALGRRSKLPIVKWFSIAFVELWRGVPLITVLFIATYMLPLFLPGGLTVDGLLRALIGVTLFSAAYMAEVVRGGLQAIPKGQTEAANALGLGYWQTMGKIVMPQALTLVIPGIVNNFIGLFKDTTLVLIVALFDLLGQIRAAFSDPNWATPTTLFTGFAFAGLIYFIFCFGMSRYSMYIERRTSAGRRR